MLGEVKACGYGFVLGTTAHFIIIFIRRARARGGQRDKLGLRRILHYNSEKRRSGVVVVLWRSKDLFSIAIAAVAVAASAAMDAYKLYRV